MKECGRCHTPGIGQEVTPEGMRVLDAVNAVTGVFRLRVTPFPRGCGHRLEHGLRDARGRV